MKNFIQNLSNCFKGDDSGYSLKKIVAFILIVMVVVIHIKWIYLGNLNDLATVLIIDYGFIASLLGLSTYHNIQKYGKIEMQKKDPE